MLTAEDIKQAADYLNIETAMIRAVDEVESGGAGFWSFGKVKILFEPHVFWRELVKEKVSPSDLLITHPDYSNILYEHWGEKPYPNPSERWPLMEKAMSINKDAAIRSASWGRYQIMGFHFKICGYDNEVSFMEAMQQDEGKHLDAFVKFNKAMGLDEFLRKKDWKGYAKRYNGAKYYVNKYDLKLDTSYEKFKKLGL